MQHPSSLIKPGFIALHGNRAEDLAQTVMGWLQQTPLAPLESEVVLVQSNGMSEWFKMELARQSGVCSAARVELPGRFLWRTYRQLLGPRSVPADSPLDKVPMTWRLMNILPALLDGADFAPVKAYLSDADPERLLQLATRLADLFDQYQNYRADWLADWARTDDRLRQANGASGPLPADQRWQAQLWRALLATLDETQRGNIRPMLHQRALATLNSSDDLAGKLPRRVVVYGMSHLPGAMLEALAALSRHCQVLLAVPNPCRYYWGDIIEGRELLRAERRRHGLRQGRDLSQVPLEALHAHAHPLLAAWGRQGRDFIRQLDAFDDAEATRRNFNLPRIDLFDETPESAHTPLLTRVQNRIRDLEPLQSERADRPIAPGDRSITFSVAHSKVRELEVLHDQLLALLAERPTGQRPLQPRDVVVMVPDIETMAPAIRAVFGQYPRADKRHIPFDIADLSAKSSSTIVQAVEWVLRLPGQRGLLSDLVDLLEVPALAKRWGLSADQMPLLRQWMSGAGMRWGLDGQHRAQLDLQACGEQNTAWFGVQRMLLGYATGSLDAAAGAGAGAGASVAGIEPYLEVGGLDAEMAGALAHLLRSLRDWTRQAGEPARPAVWAQRGRALLRQLFTAVDELDRGALSALEQALTRWVNACEQAGFDEDLALPAFRHAWLEALESPSLNRRFQAGGVTFCTLMPMRAIPFEVVCLLGMNDGDYPRHSLRSDFDLMALAGQHRPGDRSRQHDDRQLMLEALLSARRMLYLSWTGRSVRDNSEQPPSILVSQLRDYLAAVWGQSVVEQRTTEHPLQPFSRRYFEADSPLSTQAREWRSLHAQSVAAVAPAPALRSDPALEAAESLTLQRLTSFLRNPVKVFFRERLGVTFLEAEQDVPDVEPFEVKGMENYQLIRQLLQSWPVATEAAGLPAQMPAVIERLRRSGALPMGGFGDIKQGELATTLRGMATAWQQAGQDWPHQSVRQAVEFESDGVVLRDWIEHLHQRSALAPGEPTWLELEPGKLLDKKGEVRPDKLLAAWLRTVVAAACGHSLSGLLVGQDASLQMRPVPADMAVPYLRELLNCWREGMRAPLPLPLKTALTLVGDADKAAEVYQGSDYDSSMAEVRDACLARLFPDYEALSQDGRLPALALTVYGPMLQWVQTAVTVQRQH